jgi:hypothetical protein
MSSLAGEHPTLCPSDRKTRWNIDGELWLLFAALTAFYVIAIVIGGRRFVWFDELFTFDIARATTLSRLWEMIRRFDCNPPPSYLFSRLSMSILGQNSWGLRLPSMVEFYLGSAAIFAYVRRRGGASFAALATILLWTSGAFFMRSKHVPMRYCSCFAGAARMGHGRQRAAKSQACALGSCSDSAANPLQTALLIAATVL